MKKFDAPVMDIQRLDLDGIISTSSCQVCNTVGCIDCYCGVVACTPPYNCDSRNCPTFCDKDTCIVV